MKTMAGWIHCTVVSKASSLYCNRIRSWHGNNWVKSEIAETIMTDFYNYEKNKATDEDEKSLERGDARRQHIT